VGEVGGLAGFIRGSVTEWVGGDEILVSDRGGKGGVGREGWRGGGWWKRSGGVRVVIWRWGMSCI